MMTKSKTNFAHLLKCLGIRSQDLCDAIGVHKTMVSRWCNGKQTMLRTNQYVQHTCEYLLNYDTHLKQPILPGLLKEYYHQDDLLSEAYYSLFLIWLEKAGTIMSTSFIENQNLSQLALTKGNYPNRRKQEAPIDESLFKFLKTSTLYGVAGVQDGLLYFVDMIKSQETPCHFIFVCLEGLDIFTGDSKFNEQLLKDMTIAFKKGHTLDVVLGTNYEASDLSLCAGPWMEAYLLGYINLYCFDNPINPGEVKALMAIKNLMAIKVTLEEKKAQEKICSTLSFDNPSLDAIWQECESFRNQATPNIYANVFKKSPDFIKKIQPQPDKRHFQLARLPYFCVDSKINLQKDFSLNEEESHQVYREFPQFFINPNFYHEKTPIHHIFCEDDIEEALVKNDMSVHRSPLF